MLNLMFITNNPDVAIIADEAGVEYIFIDMEYIGKSERQKNMDTVQSHHTVSDIYKIKKVVKKSKILVRCNPIHNATKEYGSSSEEINAVLAAVPDMIMLPYFKTVDEVKEFIRIVDGRAKTMLLLETPEAVEKLDEILLLPGIDYIHIGLNDLSLGYKKHFMFDILADGTVDRICAKIKEKNIPFGFGGIASLGHGIVPSEIIIKEHYRLGSSFAILSRSFCNVSNFNDYHVLEKTFKRELKKIRHFEQQVMQEDDLNYNKLDLKKAIRNGFVKVEGNEISI